MQEITLYGGSDIGWLAALTEWLLDLKVMIRNSNGELYHTSSADPKSIQVNLVVLNKDDKISPNVLAAQTAVWLSDVSQIFLKEARAHDAILVSGRLRWERALSSAFNSKFKRLQEMPNTLGRCIGSAASLFMRLARAEEGFSCRLRLRCTSYSDASYGAGFVQNTSRWFPELQPYEKSMQESVRQTFASAKESYEDAISRIRLQCNCYTCKSPLTGYDVFPEEYGADARGEDVDVFCLVGIIETIISLSQLLSNVRLEESLLPTRSGLEAAYWRQMSYRTLARDTLQEVGPIAFCLEQSKRFQDGIGERLRCALGIFAGRDAPLTGANFSAVCANGICAFLDIISETSLGGAEIESASQIRIIPGRISYEKKRYEMLVDRVQPDEASNTSFKNVIAFSRAQKSQLSIRLGVRETFVGLESWIGFEIIPGMNDLTSRKVWVGPSQLALLIVRRRGLVSCAKFSLHRKQDCSWSDQRHMREIKEAAAQKRTIKLSDKAIDITTPKQTISAIAAIASAVNLGRKHNIFIVEKECLPCCMKAVLAVDYPDCSDFCIISLPQGSTD